MSTAAVTVELQKALLIAGAPRIPSLRPSSNIHPGWVTAIDMKEVLGVPGDLDELAHEDVKAAAKRAHGFLEEFRQGELAKALNIDVGELESVSDEFHTLGFVDEKPTTSEFDNVMAALYDWADCERVIIR